MTDYFNYTAKEAAKVARVSLPIMYEWCKRADFPAIKVGNKYLIPIVPFRNWLRVQAGETLSDEAREVPSDGQLV